MQDMNIKVEPGQTIAIVGPTGAGKTTLVNLLMRFYEISGGAILDRRRRHEGHEARRAAQDVRHGPPGHLALQRHDPREHRLRPRGGDRRGRGRGGQGRPRRPLHPRPARGLRHRAQRGGLQHLAGREAAPHHRAGHPRGPRHPHPGRGDEQRRHEDGGLHTEGDEGAHEGADELRDSAQALDHPRRGDRSWS